MERLQRELSLKALVDPLLWFLVVQLLLLVAFYPDDWSALSGFKRLAYSLSLFLTLSVAIMAMPLGALFMQKSLHLSVSQQGSNNPEAIFVLGGGYVLGDKPKQDALTFSSEQRAIQGALLWQQYPKASLVFQGAETRFADREPNRCVALMAEMAKAKGVLADKIQLEDKSINTRAHPIEALQLTGIDKDTPIAVVTNDWHLRRARQEFNRYFSNVMYVPAQDKPKPLSTESFIPSARTLGQSTSYLREWVGLVWYQLSHRFYANNKRTLGKVPSA